MYRKTGPFLYKCLLHTEYRPAYNYREKSSSPLTGLKFRHLIKCFKMYSCKQQRQIFILIHPTVLNYTEIQMKDAAKQTLNGATCFSSAEPSSGTFITKVKKKST